MLCPACDAGCACAAEHCYTRTSRDRDAPRPVHCASTRAYSTEYGGTWLFPSARLWWPPTDALAGRALLKYRLSVVQRSRTLYCNIVSRQASRFTFGQTSAFRPRLACKPHRQTTPCTKGVEADTAPWLQHATIRHHTSLPDSLHLVK